MGWVGKDEILLCAPILTTIKTRVIGTISEVFIKLINTVERRVIANYKKENVLWPGLT